METHTKEGNSDRRTVWIVIERNDGEPMHIGTYDTAAQAEDGLFDHLAEVNETTPQAARLEVDDTCTRTNHPGGQVSWTDGDCWEADVLAIPTRKITR